MKTRRILIISGTLENSLHPVPPVADSAPEWNVFRLSEAASRNPDGHFDIHVVSPCEVEQLEALQKFPVISNDIYHHVVFPTWYLNLYRRVLRHILPLRLVVRRLTKLPDLLSWWYLRRVVKIMRGLSPDWIFINARPQYIRYLRRRVPKGHLFFFMRGPLGESRRFLSMLDGIIVNSRGMSEYVHRFIEPDHPPVWQMPNSLGDEFDAVVPLPDRFTHSAPTILFAGRLIPEKGVLELLEAFRLVLDQIPQAQLVICGASDNYKVAGSKTEYEQEIQRRVIGFPEGRVVLRGYVPNRELAQEYVSTYLAVFPSRIDIYVESFGMVALEAMRCRTPVVASRQPGFEELVLPGETGFLVDDPRDTRALADAMLRILKDPIMAQRMGEAGYRRSLEYTPEKALKTLEEILQQYSEKFFGE